MSQEEELLPEASPPPVTEAEVDPSAPPATESSDEAAAPPTTEELAAAMRQAQGHWDKFVRAQAELENLKRRAEKDVQDARKFALERFAKELLPVADSLELGLGVEIGDNPEAGKLREGMELTLRQLLSTLEKFQITPVEAENEKFNPELHQAMAMQPTDQAEPNTVIKVYQKGYVLNGRLLRPAMVVVSQAIA